MQTEKELREEFHELVGKIKELELKEDMYEDRIIALRDEMSRLEESREKGIKEDRIILREISDLLSVGKSDAEIIKTLKCNEEDIAFVKEMQRNFSNI